ncbi:MAG: hypothetical protein R2856_17090 [Caldilineaceae bacterium]
MSSIVAKLAKIQRYLQQEQIDGWLLYSFRDQNPIALSLVGLQHGGSRRWFLWIPAQGSPSWLIHAIESNSIVDVDPVLKGSVEKYVSWQELETQIPKLVKSAKRMLMEYSPDNAIPYVSRVDAGMYELVKRVTGAAGKHGRRRQQGAVRKGGGRGQRRQRRSDLDQRRELPHAQGRRSALWPLHADPAQH